MQADREQLELWDREHVWHPFTPMQVYASEKPIIIERAEGCYLFDLEGNRYIDGVSSLWCNLHGHRVPEIDQAIRDQLDQIAHSTLLGLSNVPAIKLARKLAEMAPEGLTRVFFSDDGATAVEVALKMTLQYWRQRSDPRPNKIKYLALTQAYHGDTIGDVSVGGIPRFHATFEPLLFPTLRAPQPHCYRCPLGLERSSCQIDCVGELENMVREHHEEIAAVVIEPKVQAAAGMIVAPEGYLRRVRDITREHDVLLIADEVVTAFGRSGSMWACEQEGVIPDFLCLAKGLSAGYVPIAATLTHDEIYNAFLGKPEEQKTFYHGHTYCGNPLGAATALANLELIENNQVIENLPTKVNRFAEHLNRIRELPMVGDVRHLGMLAGIELVQDKSTKQGFAPEIRMGAKVCKEARSRGAWIRPLGDVVVVMPALAMDLELLDELCAIVSGSIQHVTCQLSIADVDKTASG